MNQNNRKLLICLLFALGLLIRVGLIDTKGTADFSEYVKWGKGTYEKGLVGGFQGGYFPIQYQSFQASYTIADKLSLPPDKVIRIFNLIFELGCLALIAYILRKHLSLTKIMAFFWLNPFALVIFQQGYVDAQFAFFVLAALALMASDIGGLKNWPEKYILAGLPLGIALLMKPQPIPIFVALGILFVMLFAQRKRRDAWKIACIVILPVILYAGYSLYFAVNMDIYDDHKSLPRVSEMLQEKAGFSKGAADLSAASLFLTGQYAYTAKNKAAINVQMNNPWFLVATTLNKDDLPIYRVSDTLKLFGISYRNIGFLLLFAAAITILLRIARRETDLDTKIILASCVMPILLPYLATNAHENHFYLGFILITVMGAILADKLTIKAGYALSCLGALNLAVYYILPYYLGVEKSTSALLTLSAATTIVLFIFLYHAFKKETWSPKPIDLI